MLLSVSSISVPVLNLVSTVQIKMGYDVFAEYHIFDPVVTVGCEGNAAKLYHNHLPYIPCRYPPSKIKKVNAH